MITEFKIITILELEVILSSSGHSDPASMPQPPQVHSTNGKTQKQGNLMSKPEQRSEAELENLPET